MKCRKCNIEKDIEEFYFKTDRGKYDTMCKKCHRVYRKEHYRKNTEYYKNKQKRNRNKYFTENKKIILESLKTGCVDCGEKNIITLQFDHIEGYDKKMEISKMVSSYHPNTVKDEIKKCEVVCANCHLKRTADRSNNWWKLDYKI